MHISKKLLFLFFVKCLIYNIWVSRSFPAIFAKCNWQPTEFRMPNAVYISKQMCSHEAYCFHADLLFQVLLHFCFGGSHLFEKFRR